MILPTRRHRTALASIGAAVVDDAIAAIDRVKGRLYDGEIASTDAQLGRLVDHLHT